MKTHRVLEAIGYANFSIGRDLRAMRTEAGISQADVARKAGLRPEALCRIESGQGNPTVETVSRLVRAIKALS